MKKFFQTIKDNEFYQKIFLVVLVSIFSGLLGGLVSYSFQNRSWEHQHRSMLQEAETGTALKIFEETSKLLDKRIYRMTKLNWALEENISDSKIEDQMNFYREVLYEWNDNFNRNRALINIYFGEDIQVYFSNDIHTAIKNVGKLLEEYYYTPRKDRKNELGYEIDGRIGDLENKAYELNLRMLNAIQNQKVGVIK